MKTLSLSIGFFLIISVHTYANAMQPVSLDNLLTSIDGRAVGFDRNGIAFPAVGIDSRSIQPEELFWAVQGERHDGHEFLGEAFNRGATACVVEADKITATAGPVVVVENTLKALWDFSRWYRKTQDALIVGVTGSVGKTTTREMIHTVLTSQYQGIRSPKNFIVFFLYVDSIPAQEKSKGRLPRR